ncbi:MAG TPA: MobF family relaxase [Acidimicrobiia bacterium]|jgi:conjugative relaxase-like TrwC/TraI family protein
MLSIGKLRLEDGVDYYLRTVADGTEEYYTAQHEAPGRWIASSELLVGLSGEVSGYELREVLEGRDPSSGLMLVSSRRTRPGFDLCFSAPKSMSLLFVFGDSAIRRAVVEAHERAVQASLDYLEREACWVRRGHAGVLRVRADGFIAAAFRHRTSRAGDPQLHTHVVVANAARGPDGKWSALHGYALYESALTAGYLYQAHLRHEISRSLGVRWGPVISGCAEMAEIPAHVLEAFSKRSADIERKKAEQGVTGRHGAKIATLATRPAKDPEVDVASLFREWERQAADLGFEATTVRSLISRRVHPGLGRVNDGEVVDSLTLRQSTFERAEVVRAVAERAPDGAAVGEIERYADALLAGDRVVRVADDMYSTPPMLRLEAGILETAQRRLGGGLGVADVGLVETEISRRLVLSADQEDMVRQLTTSGNGVEVVLGVAGAGKTSGLECARTIWEASGYQTIGVALAARAAVELETRSGIPSCTLDALLRDLAQPGGPLPSRTVVVVDEAAMVDTRRLARLLVHTDAAGTKVVLVGDDHQLPEIGAGGAFAGLLRQLPAVVLAENRRQTDAVDRLALAELRTGNAEAAVRRLVANGRISLVDTADAAREQMVHDWRAATRGGDDAVMLASRRVDVEDLNRRARSQLVEEGAVYARGITIHGHEFAVGDRVMTLSNRRRLGVTNGDRGTVVAICDGEVAMRLDRGPTIALPASYLHACHLTHAYATTIHKAQGMTCDRALVLANNAMFREAGYTALSRGRKENRLYVITPDRPDVDVGHGIFGDSDHPLDRLVSTLEQSRAKHLALEELMRGPAVDPPALGRGIDL